MNKNLIATFAYAIFVYIGIIIFVNCSFSKNELDGTIVGIACLQNGLNDVSFSVDTNGDGKTDFVVHTDSITGMDILKKICQSNAVAVKIIRLKTSNGSTGFFIENYNIIKGIKTVMVFRATSVALLLLSNHLFN